MQDAWQYSTVHNSACKVIEEQTLWGQTVCRIWLPNQDAVVRVPRSALRPLSADLQPEIEAGRIAYVVAAAKVAEVLEGSTSTTDGQVLLAPMESHVIPLPHQIHALSRAISGDRVRYLLADEVGLGKTIEAGLGVCQGSCRVSHFFSGLFILSLRVQIYRPDGCPIACAA